MECPRVFYFRIVRRRLEREINSAAHDAKVVVRPADFRRRPTKFLAPVLRVDIDGRLGEPSLREMP
jgi:hypothetical protein